MPSGYEDVFDFPVKGICPVTKTQPSASTAWLKGATGSGAPSIMWKIGRLMMFPRGVCLDYAPR
jgi:hypothetical protein